MTCHFSCEQLPQLPVDFIWFGQKDPNALVCHLVAGRKKDISSILTDLSTCRVLDCYVVCQHIYCLLCSVYLTQHNFFT